MTELHDQLWALKYRPQTFDDLILEDIEIIKEQLKNNGTIPSFLLYSKTPGIGKTSTAKVIINEIGCDYIMINSSDDRGIDVIRDRVKTFVQAMSSDGKKRCVFLDEADGITKDGQDSLKNIMETYADNCFFILTCNEIGKIREPIISRCVTINYGLPSKSRIRERLEYICKQEKVDTSRGIDLDFLINYCYPDIRSMVKNLQNYKLTGSTNITNEDDFKSFYELIVKKEVKEIYRKIYSENFDFAGFNKWMFKFIFENYNQMDEISLIEIISKLADTEKHLNMGVNTEVVFIANILNIMRLI